MRRFVALVLLGAAVTSGCGTNGKPSADESRAACVQAFPDQIGAHDERPFPDYMARCLDAAKHQD